MSSIGKKQADRLGTCLECEVGPVWMVVEGPLLSATLGPISGQERLRAFGELSVSYSLT